MTLYRRIGKRALDLGLTVPSLVVLVPIGVAIGAVLRLKLGSPVLFRQLRPSRDGRLFELVKFRTMTEARDASGAWLPDAQRLTPFGRWLRATSLDELPTLWNVVRGEMSLVGPRPLLVEYLDHYTPEQRRRHDVLPGITGWAQIHGRNELSWQEKFELDVWYVDNVSLKTDLHILLRTALQVLRRRGISAAGHATMPEFTGNHEESTR
jgi:lipopolysaccharide/colanic/teichoic acid biosynthesis glycosyltransferase